MTVYYISMKSKIISMTENILDEVFSSCENIADKNDVFIIKNKNRKVVAKILYSDSSAGAQFEIDILKHLNRRLGVINACRSLVDAPIIVDTAPMIIYEVIDGRALGADDIGTDLMSGIASAQSIMHKQLSEFSSPRTRFLPEDLSFADNATVSGETHLKQAIEVLVRMRANIDFSNMSETIIHDDISMDNILIGPSGVHLVDFGDAHRSYRISDIAVAVKELIIDNLGIDKEKINKYCSDYSHFASLPLTDAELAALPYLTLRRAVFMYVHYASREHVSEKKLFTQLNTINLLLREYR